MSRLIFLSRQDVMSRVMLNGGIASYITLMRFVRLGCALSSLLVFAIVTHHLLAMLSSLAINGVIVGLQIPYVGQLVAHVFYK